MSDEEEPFFTSGHVFFTTTGLRALDPVLAMKENPWSDIGRLAVGHVLLRLNRMTGRYEKIVIESISAKVMPQIEKVYGVHLREGRRSYHANGYLVSVNYPEVWTSVNLRSSAYRFTDYDQKYLQNHEDYPSSRASENVARF